MTKTTKRAVGVGADDARKVTLLVCKECGSTDVQVMEWVDANTNALIGGAESSGAADTFCETCDEEGRDPNPGVRTAEFPLSEALERLSGRDGFDRDAVVEGAHP
jgi:hypothetical protein